MDIFCLLGHQSNYLISDLADVLFLPWKGRDFAQDLFLQCHVFPIQSL